MILELFKENWQMILMCGFIFLNGVAIGAAVTDAINSWEPKRREKKRNEQQIGHEMDRR